MIFETKLVSSLTKVFPDEIMGQEFAAASALKNEPFSFQIAFKKGDEVRDPLTFYIRFESDLELKFINTYKVGYVPIIHPAPARSDEHFDRKTPGLYPDILYRRNNENPVYDEGFWEPQHFEKGERITLTAFDTYQSLWFTVNENGEEIKAGNYNIAVVFYSSKDATEIGRETFKLEIIDKCLVPQDVLNTSWFHVDCLCDVYGVEMWSDKHFEIIESFVHEAALNGQNMIMLPAFTPPLDTPVGAERKTAQLVNVEVENGEYKFDFSLMRRYVETCFKAGATHFEHSHLFTQWGARSAPKIVAMVDGEVKKIFGWDTDSKSPEYAKFLKAYLKELKVFLKESGINKNILFHISDEPMTKHITYYHNAKEVVKSEIDGFMCGDALSGYEYYADGTVETPIVAVSSPDMEKFVKNCDNLWVYNTGDLVYNSMPNRLITTTGARNRILGTQMYYTNAKGYLNWALNFYYGVMCHGVFNPMQNPSGGFSDPGASFQLYPDPTGVALPSLRIKILNEAFIDNRALKTLESMIGRENVMALCEKHFGTVNYNFCPTNDQLLSFRLKVNSLIKANM